MADLIQLRGGTAAAWTAANPILAEREMGIETDTWLYKIGDGVTNWVSLAYTSLRLVDEGTIINFADQSHPSTPAAGTLNLYAKSLAGRMLFRQQGPSGLITPLQPALFQNNVAIISTSTTTSLSVLGTNITTVGTVSHPTVTESFGMMANFISAATLAATVGTGDAAVRWCRGSTAGANGWFHYARLAFPDGSYNETGASTGTRIFVGLTDQTMAVSVGANDPAGNRFGFSRLHVNASITETNWFVSSRNGFNESRINTGLPFIAQKVYDFYTFCAPQGTTCYWRIDNVSDGTSAEGSTSTYLPTNSTFMRAGFQVQTVDAVARNIRMQRQYVESDR
jgi:hypothetical protein